MNVKPKKFDYSKVLSNIKRDTQRLLSFESVSAISLYQDIFQLCTATPESFSEQLYNDMKKFFKSHVKSRKKELSTVTGNILPLYIEKWKAYYAGTKSLSVVFRYLNNTYINRKKEEFIASKTGGIYFNSSKKRVYEIEILALMAWKKYVFKCFKDTLNKEILYLIHMERDGSTDKKLLISDVMESYACLSENQRKGSKEPFMEEFLQLYLTETRNYYLEESTLYLSEKGITEYLIRACERTLEEEDRARRYFTSEYFEQLNVACDEVLIKNHYKTIMRDFDVMFEKFDVDNLRRVFFLFSRIPSGIDPLISYLSNFIITRGTKEIESYISNKNSLTPEMFVESILQTIKKFKEFIKDAFNDTTIFVDSLDKSSRILINEKIFSKDPNRSSELLVKYIDNLLSKKKKEISLNESELDMKLKEITEVFKLVDDKDIFEKYYTKMLARRLIYGSYSSIESEKFMVSCLKEACSFEYTSKLQRMFNDINISNDLAQKFKDWIIENKQETPIEMTTYVLTAGIWPIQNLPNNYTIPFELEYPMNCFMKFYSEIYSGRKLNWVHNMCRAEVKILFLKKKYKCQVNSLQLSIILLFNSLDNFTFDDVLKLTGMSKEDANIHLRSFIESGLILSSNKDLNSATFSLNPDYSNKRLRFKIAIPSNVEKKTQEVETKKSIEDDRRVYLQAIIVRIMKTRKQLSHNALIQEVIQHAKSRFNPNIMLIKKCIEHLIEKEFIERIDDNIYRYLS